MQQTLPKTKFTPEFDIYHGPENLIPKDLDFDDLNLGHSLNGIEGPDGLYLLNGHMYTGQEIKEILSMIQNGDEGCPFQPYYFPEPESYQGQDQSGQPQRINICFSGEPGNTYVDIGNIGSGKMAIQINQGEAFVLEDLCDGLQNHSGFYIDYQSCMTDLFAEYTATTTPAQGYHAFIGTAKTNFVAIEYKDGYLVNPVMTRDGEIIQLPVGEFVRQARYSFRKMSELGYTNLGSVPSDPIKVYEPKSDSNELLSIPLTVALLASMWFAIGKAISDNKAKKAAEVAVKEALIAAQNADKGKKSGDKK